MDPQGQRPLRRGASGGTGKQVLQVEGREAGDGPSGGTGKPEPLRICRSRPGACAAAAARRGRGRKRPRFPGSAQRQLQTASPPPGSGCNPGGGDARAAVPGDVAPATVLSSSGGVAIRRPIEEGHRRRQFPMFTCRRERVSPPCYTASSAVMQPWQDVQRKCPVGPGAALTGPPEFREMAAGCPGGGADAPTR